MDQTLAQILRHISQLEQQIVTFQTVLSELHAINPELVNGVLERLNQPKSDTE